MTKWEKWELTKWEVNKVGIDKYAKNLKKNVMLSMWTRCWDVVDCVTDVLAIIRSMYSEELMQLWTSLESSIYMDCFSFAELV